MPDYGFGRCDGHHETVDLRLRKIGARGLPRPTSHDGRGPRIENDSGATIASDFSGSARGCGSILLAAWFGVRRCTETQRKPGRARALGSTEETSSGRTLDA